MQRTRIWLLTVVLWSAGAALIAAAQAPGPPAVTQIRWQDILRQTPEWYGSHEAVRIADNVLAFQRDEGGWPKNIDMARALTEQDFADILRQKQNDDSTIDNTATWTQLTLLARVYTAKRLQSHKDAFLKGVDYLLNALINSSSLLRYFGGYPIQSVSIDQ